jgi:RsiW-degrading membrane proteinase PrsW (M82 family)
LALLVVLVFWILGFVVAAGRPETGPFEDVVLIALIGGLFALAVPVRRIGTAPRS